MKKTMIYSAALALAIGLGLAGTGSAAAVEKADGFVCPVFNSNSAVGEHNPNAVQIGGGDYTIVGPDVSVPEHATNADGEGTPGGDHSVPGDIDYTAIWGG